MGILLYPVILVFDADLLLLLTNQVLLLPLLDDVELHPKVVNHHRHKVYLLLLVYIFAFLFLNLKLILLFLCSENS